MSDTQKKAVSIKNINFGLKEDAVVAKSVANMFYELSLGGNEAAKSKLKP